MSTFINPREPGSFLTIDISIFEANQDNVKRIRAALIAKKIKVGEAGRYRFVWDEWELYALHEGLTEEMASLGRAVMRECMQHTWPQKFWKEVGPSAGMSMLSLAKNNAAQAKARWEHLLETDGELDLEWGDLPDKADSDS